MSRFVSEDEDIEIVDVLTKDELEELDRERKARTLGGPGSGNFGHGGRPGERGSSSSEGLVEAKELTEHEADLVRGWVEDENTPIIYNETLRHGQADAFVRDEIKKLASAVQKSTTTKDAVLYRGVGKDVVDRLKVGQTFTDKGFTSLTPKRSVAALFTGSGYEHTAGGSVLEVRVPKGTHLLDVNRVTQGYTSHPDEHEHLLAPGTKFRVVARGVLEIIKK